MDFYNEDLAQFYTNVLGQRHFDFYHEFDGATASSRSRR